MVTTAHVRSSAATATALDWRALSRQLLVAVLLLAPLAFGAVQSWAWTSLTLLVAVAFFCWGLSCVQRGAVQFVWTPLYMPAVLFLLLGGFQLFWGRSYDPVATRNSLLMLGTDLIIFFLSVNLFASRNDSALRRRRERLWRGLAWALTIYTLGVSVFALAQFFSAPDQLYWTVRSSGYIFGPYVSHNNYAGLMEMLVPLVLAFLLWWTPNRAARSLVAFALLISIASVIVSGSRGGVTALLVEFVIAWIIWRSRWSGVQTVALMLLATAAVGLALWWIPHDVLERFQTALDTPDIGYHDRKLMTADALHIAGDHMAIGTGLGSFETVYPKYQSLATDYLIDYAHNDYAQALAETGVAGGVIICFALACFLSGITRLQLAAGTVESYIRLGALVGCCGLLVHSWVDFNLHIPANAAWFAFLAGLTQSTSRGAEQHVRA